MARDLGTSDEGRPEAVGRMQMLFAPQTATQSVQRTNLIELFVMQCVLPELSLRYDRDPAGFGHSARPCWSENGELRLGPDA